MKSLTGRPRLMRIITVSFLFLLSSAVTKALRPIYFVDVGASPMQLGLILTVHSMFSLLTRVPASTLSNRLGRWRMMFFSICLCVVLTFFLAFVRDPVLFFPLMGTLAMTWAIYSPIAVEYVSNQSTAATRGGIMGLFFTSNAAAIFVGPLIASILTVFFSLRQLFLFSAIFPVISLVVFLMTIRPSDLDGVSSDMEVSTDEPPVNIGTSLYKIFRNRNFVSMCISRIAWSFSMGIFTTIYPIFASEGLGLKASAISLLFTFQGFTNLVIRIPSGRLSDRIGRRKPFIVSYAIFIFAYVVLAYAENFGIIVMTMAIFGLGWGMQIAPAMAIVSESVEDKYRNLAISVFMTMFNVGSMIGTLLIGITGALLSTQTLLLICAVVMIVALFVFVLLSRNIDPHVLDTVDE